MSRKVYCKKLKQEAEGLNCPHYPGELGEKIYQHISKAAWDKWIEYQTILINEHSLSLVDPEAREFLKHAMVKFLFGT